MVLSDLEIKAAIEKGEIIIENFEERCLQPASYDLRAGKQGIVTKSMLLGEGGIVEGLTKDSKVKNLETRKIYNYPSKRILSVDQFRIFQTVSSLRSPSRITFFLRKKGISSTFSSSGRPRLARDISIRVYKLVFAIDNTQLPGSRLHN